MVSWPEAETHRDRPKNKAVNQLLTLSRWFPANLLFKSLPLQEQKSASEDMRATLGCVTPHLREKNKCVDVFFPINCIFLFNLLGNFMLTKRQVGIFPG